MKYFNQYGETVIRKKIQLKKMPTITGWAIDISKCQSFEMEEFIRLWKKISPTPLYNNNAKPN
jgi:hypothetical protein